MSKYYLDNKRFEELIVLYLNCKQTPNPHEDELMGMFGILIGTILDSFKFNVERDDAVQDCYYLILKKLRNFGPEKGSAFNYFTTVILNNLRLVYSKNKKYEAKLEVLFNMKKDYLE